MKEQHYQLTNLSEKNTDTQTDNHTDGQTANHTDKQTNRKIVFSRSFFPNILVGNFLASSLLLTYPNIDFL